MSNDRGEVLGDLYDELIADIRKRIKDGTAGAADLAVAQRLLKDAGISSLVTPDAPVLKLAGELPFKAQKEDDVAQTG